MNSLIHVILLILLIKYLKGTVLEKKLATRLHKKVLRLCLSNDVISKLVNNL